MKRYTLRHLGKDALGATASILLTTPFWFGVAHLGGFLEHDIPANRGSHLWDGRPGISAPNIPHGSLDVTTPLVAAATASKKPPVAGEAAHPIAW